MRTHCNIKQCALPKPGTEHEVGYNPQPGGVARRSNHPEGSWKCPYCANINWPQRTVCNKQECRQPRPSDAEMAQIEQQQQMQVSGVSGAGSGATVGVG